MIPESLDLLCTEQLSFTNDPVKMLEDPLFMRASFTDDISVRKALKERLIRATYRIKRMGYDGQMQLFVYVCGESSFQTLAA